MDIAVVAVEGIFDSGLAAVLDVLAAANTLRRDDTGAPPFQVTVIGSGTQVRTGNGLRLDTVPAADLPRAPDLLLTPALGLKTPEQVVESVRSKDSAWVLPLIRDLADAATPLAAACTGTFFLAESGILQGMRATTSWWLGPAFRSRYPAVRLDEAHTLIHDAPVTTAGAAFAHIDLALWVVRRHSPDLADIVARYLLIGDRPSQAAFAVPTLLAQTDPTTAGFERWIRTHLADPPPLAQAARSLGISERTLQRATQAVLGMSPLDFVQEVRIDEATFLLRTTTLSAEAIADRVGYRNVATLRALVRRKRQSTLEGLRRN
jgi:transcriptional regulator GlxA family with amidase domain